MAFRRLSGWLSRSPNFEHLTLTGGDPQAWEHFDKLLDLTGLDFDMQVSTALMKRPTSNWRRAFADVRVSLDAITPAMYQSIRGVVRNPVEVLEWLAELDHPRTSIITTLSEVNAVEFVGLVEAVQAYLPDVRRHMVLPVLGDGVDRRSEPWWQRLVRTYRGDRKMTFGDEPAYWKGDRCWTRRISCHVKANGDVYPCCLVGGEAIETQQQMRLSGGLSSWKSDVAFDRWWKGLHDGGAPPQCYEDNDVCRKVCQYKQARLNHLAEAAQATRLAMP